MPQQPNGLEHYLKVRQTGDQVIEEAKRLLRTVQAIYLLVSSALSIPMEVLLHHSFGVRYLNSITFGIGLFVLILAMALSTPLDSADDGSSAIGLVILALYTALGIVHIVSAHRRHSRGVEWHSRSPGIPWGVWKLVTPRNPFMVVRIYEPALVALAGLGLLGAGVNYGSFLIVAAVIVWSRRTLEAWELRNQILDEVDRQIEAKTLSEAVEDTRTPWKTAGYVVPEVAVSTGKALAALTVDEAREKLGARFAELKPETDRADV